MTFEYPHEGPGVDPLEWLDLEMLEDRRGREEGLIQRKVRRCRRGPRQSNARSKHWKRPFTAAGKHFNVRPKHLNMTLLQRGITLQRAFTTAVRTAAAARLVHCAVAEGIGTVKRSFCYSGETHTHPIVHCKVRRCRLWNAPFMEGITFLTQAL